MRSLFIKRDEFSGHSGAHIIVPGVWRQRQENDKFQISLGYTSKPIISRKSRSRDIAQRNSVFLGVKRP